MRRGAIIWETVSLHEEVNRLSRLLFMLMKSKRLSKVCESTEFFLQFRGVDNHAIVFLFHIGLLHLSKTIGVGTGGAEGAVAPPICQQGGLSPPDLQPSVTIYKSDLPSFVATTSDNLYHSETLVEFRSAKLS